MEHGGEQARGEAEPAGRDRTQTIVRRSGSSDSGRAVTPAAVTPPQPETGDDSYQLLEGDPDRYTNKGEHARGGLGRVLRARDHRLGRTVAIKELLHQSDAAESRFVREALITARLQHPGVVPVHEAGRWPNGEPYYVMKLISGRSMKELIRDRETVSERLALLPNVIAVAETIAYAHSEGVIHRDIKPANVVVGEFGETVVVDWGIAKDRSGQVAPAPGEVDTRGGGSQTAGVLGTPCYMAPEQARGDDVDERADVYALGALLYEVLGGEQPYSDADSGDVLTRVLAGPPVPLEDHTQGVPPDLLAIVRKAMHRVPSDRYRTAKELAEDLKRYQTGQLVTAHDYSTVTLLKRWMWRNRALVGVLAVAVGVVAVLGSLAVSRVIDEKNAAEIQRDKAQQASQSTEKRRRQLLLLQARSSLSRDPTATVAWLKSYPKDAEGALTLRSMLDEAESLGVARHVIRLGGWGMGVAFSPDGTLIATASNDKKVRIHRVDTGETRVVGSHTTAVNSIAYAPDGAHLLTGAANGEVGLWDVATGESTVVQGHKGTVMMAAFSPSGKRGLTSAEHYSLRVWDTATMKALITRAGPAGFSPSGDAAVWIDPDTHVFTVVDVEAATERALPTKGFKATDAMLPSVSNGGSEVAALDDQGNVWHYTAAAGWRILGRHPTKVQNLQFSNTGRYVTTMGFDKTIRVFETDPAVPEAKRATILRGHLDDIYMVAFSPDDRYALSAGDDATARLWDLASPEAAVRVLRGHDDDVYRLAVSPDGSTFATVSLDGTARLWSGGFDDANRLREGEVVAGVVWLDDDNVGAHDWEGRLTGWNVSTHRRTDVMQLAKPGRSKNAGVVSRDRTHTAGVDPDEKTILVWNGGKELIRLASPGFEQPSVWGFAPDDRHLLATYAKGGVVMWDVVERTPKVLAGGEYKGPAALSPDGREVALYHGASITVWDLGEEKPILDKPIAELGASDGFLVHQLQYSQDGRWLGAFCMFGEIALIDRKNGSVRVLGDGEARMTSATFSDDGRYVGAASNDRNVRLWRTDTGEVKVFGGHTDLVHRVAFSRDGSMMASASYDKTVRLWDPETGRSRVLRGHTASVDTVAFSPDGKRLASGSRDKTIRIWNIEGALDEVDAAAVRARMKAITSAVIAPDDRPETITR